MSRRALIACILAFPISVAAQSEPQSSSIARLAPAAFPNLPTDVAGTLESRGCRVPQTADAKAPENIIRGAFTAAHASEWAVLCSIADTGRILILQRRSPGDVRVVDSLPRGPDVGCMQAIGYGRWAYSCLLHLRAQRTIRSWSRTVHGRVDHDAIENIFVGKAAVAYYIVKGHWYRFVTAD